MAGPEHADPATLHIPVLLDECLAMLAPAFTVEKPILIDCTLGMGGHTHAVLERFPNVTVIGIDRDPEAISIASRRLSTFGSRFHAVHTTYDHVDEVAQEYGHDGKVEAVLMDLGVSSLQLDEEKRGFSYAVDAPLDMRMNPTDGPTAADLIAHMSAAELTRILRIYGEERFASRIARNIVTEREKTPILRTGQLADIVRRSIPAPARRTGGNPSKRTFQALRIAVNDELRILEHALPRALSSIRIGGRLVVESYQSLEDRIVKDIFKRGATDQAPPEMPVIPPHLQARLTLLTRGAQRAHTQEQEHNPRSASVRLRGAQIIAPWKE
ncbi:16S rRNA (cytosine(1402)-N(4))-methyltransferase RsmH [Schaalia sp. lx-260]|uniref:16S rRNA (cytosine(1402)-N(4))-methyltransferase RsmH n=1 Tax=Schaalia sp. lx-260 TaxID=2899082 RepID=UPI001E5888FD|nr:16S rRNA (cytosine(1402)-N(4))-methyltransferase RsmH [Schaalia sp. lx-260]MCD4549236.1 16S rRNA (cytosine(1402)-N(4))-methyltransferase RsmH [Schaalia sp. lx-260]